MEKEFITAIENFIKRFRENPFRYLYESDIKCGLYCELSSFYDTLISLEPKHWKQENFGPIINFAQLTTEYKYLFKYGNNSSKQASHQRIDIAILDKDNVLTLDKINLPGQIQYMGEAIWLQPVKYGIELKLSSGLDYPPISSIETDIQKLRMYYHSFSNRKNLNVGLSICFCHTGYDNIPGYIVLGEKEELSAIIKEDKFLSIIVFPKKIYYQYFLEGA